MIALTNKNERTTDLSIQKVCENTMVRETGPEILLNAQIDITGNIFCSSIDAKCLAGQIVVTIYVRKFRKRL